MSDIAEVGFIVRTEGLRQGSDELDKLNKKAKETEDQAKRTGDALNKSGDGAKKMGADAKTAADGMEAMSDAEKKVIAGLEQQITKMQMTSAEYRVYQNLQKAGTTLNSEAGKSIAALTLAHEAQRAGVDKATVSNGALGRSLQALFPAMTSTAAAATSTATAAKAMAVEKQAAAISSANLAAALNTARPAVIGLGGAMGTLPAVAAAARFGIAGVATAITGGLLVALTNIMDKIDAARGRLGAITGSFKTGAEAVETFQKSAADGGASVDGMSSAYQKMLSVLRTPPSEPGVIRIGENVDAVSRKIAEFQTSASRALREKFVDPAEIDRQLGVFADAFKAAGGRITGDVLRGVNEKAPELGRALALGFLGREGAEGENIIASAARQLNSFPRGLDAATEATRRYQSVSDAAYDPNRVKPLSQALDELGRTASDIIERVGRVGGLSGIVDEANARLKRGAEAASQTDFGSDTSRTNATAMQPQAAPSLWRRITDADRAMFGDDPTGVGGLVNRFNSWIADQFKGQEGERGAKFSDLMGGGSGSLSRGETSDILEGINKSLVGFDDVATELQKAAESAKGAEGAIDSVGDELSDAGDASAELKDSLSGATEVVSAAGTSMTQAASGADAFATALPAAAEAAAAFAGTTTEAMGTASSAIGQANEASATFAQVFDGSMQSAAGSAEANADRIVSAMQAIINAANAAAAAQANATGGGFGGVGASPYAKGAAFSGGRVIPMAKGRVVTEPEFFPMADGAIGLRGEAGPEAVMPLGRTSGGDLGVKVAGGGSRSLVPSDPFVDIETAIEDQTTELRNAMDSQADAIGGDITKSAADIIAAIKSSPISIGAAGGSSLGSVGGAFGGSAAGPGGELRTSVQIGDGSGRYTSSQSFAGMGSSFQQATGQLGNAGTSLSGAATDLYGAASGLQSAAGQMRTSVQSSSGSGGGSNALDPAFFGNRDSIFAGENVGGGIRIGGGGGSRLAPAGDFGGGSSSGGRSGLPGGYGSGGSGGGSTFGRNSMGGGPPSDWAPSNNWGYTTPDGAWQQTANPYGGDYMTGDNYIPNYDYGSDTSRTNDSYMGGGGGEMWAAGEEWGNWGGDSYSGGDYYTSPSEDYYGGAYATGGSFVVPGAGGTDSVRVGLDATPGEIVSVSKPGQGGTAGGTTIEGGINISLHGITRPNEWIENEAAINARVAQAVKEALDAR